MKRGEIMTKVMVSMKDRRICKVLVSFLSSQLQRCGEGKQRGNKASTKVYGKTFE